MCSPVFIKDAMAETAAIPLEKTRAAAPPSNEARFSSNRVRVGFPARE
jgi:hypothetical protein